MRLLKNQNFLNQGGLFIKKINISTYKHGKLYFAVAVKDEKIIRAILPESSKKEALDEITAQYDSYDLSGNYKHLAESLCNLYHGKNVTFRDNSFILDLNDFQKKVLLEVKKIPHGEVRTYKQISEAINSKAYRAVGTAIGKNPLPLIIPCHRVIRSDFKVGGFFGGSEMKKEILKNEGIHIVDDRISK